MYQDLLLITESLLILCTKVGICVVKLESFVQQNNLVPLEMCVELVVDLVILHKD